MIKVEVEENGSSGYGPKHFATRVINTLEMPDLESVISYAKEVLGTSTDCNGWWGGIRYSWIGSVIVESETIRGRFVIGSDDSIMFEADLLAKARWTHME